MVNSFLKQIEKLRIERFIMILFVLFIFSCTNKNENSKGKSISLINYSKDTAYINLQLKKILTNENINNDSVFIMLKALRNQAAKINYKKGVGEAKFVEGVVNYDFSDYKSALNCFDQAVKIAKEISDTLLIANCLEKMASVNLSIGDGHFALRLFYESLPLFEKINNKEGIAKVCNILGYYKSEENNYDSAEMYYNKAMILNIETGNIMGLIHNKGNLAYIYEKTAKYDKAKQIYWNLIELLKNEDSQFNLTVTYNNLALLYQKQNLTDSSISYLQKGLSISEKIQDKSMISILQQNLGELFITKHFYDAASISLNKSMEYASETGDIELKMKAIMNLMQIDTLKGNYKEAVRKSMQILVLRDTIYKKESQHNIKVSELQYENQNKRELIENQNLLLLSSKKQSKIYISLFILLSVILSLLIAFVLMMIKHNLKKKKLLTEQLLNKELQLENALKTEEINKLSIEKYENEVKTKVKEQISIAMALEQKTKFLELIKEKFSEALNNNNTIHLNELNELVSSLKTQLLDSNDMDMFNEKFTSLHRNFYDKLKQSHPDLSKNELKFCAYLKLNLNSNQISSILNVTVEAIRKSRYRIRKKLNLSQADSLEDYISIF